jgi:hypothetical protein
VKYGVHRITPNLHHIEKHEVDIAENEVMLRTEDKLFRALYKE